jgi:hypothetical protein
MIRTFGFRMLALILSVVLLASCGGGGGGTTTSASTAPGFHNVTISWAANHEKGVNTTGGGYSVSISGQSAPAAIDVPFVSGPTAPTSITTSLYSGTYTALVTAHAMLDSNGGSTGVTSAPSSTISINVP